MYCYPSVAGSIPARETFVTHILRWPTWRWRWTQHIIVSYILLTLVPARPNPPSLLSTWSAFIVLLLQCQNGGKGLCTLPNFGFILFIFELETIQTFPCLCFYIILLVCITFYICFSSFLLLHVFWSNTHILFKDYYIFKVHV